MPKAYWDCHTPAEDMETSRNWAAFLVGWLQPISKKHTHQPISAFGSYVVYEPTTYRRPEDREREPGNVLAVAYGEPNTTTAHWFETIPPAMRWIEAQHQLDAGMVEQPPARLLEASHV